MASKLAALALLVALLGCVAHTCQAGYGFPYPSSAPKKSSSPAAPTLNYAHYYRTCKGAEKIVRDVVQEEIKRNRDIGAGLIRLFFHDCFVQGCDASVLLDKTPANESTEKFGLPNIGSLRGFEVIDKIKTKLEAKCKGVVSCADIVAFVGRDATYFLSNKKVYFEMPAGRYDGRVSSASETLFNLPPPFANITVLEAMFAAKGLNLDEMVTLSGAHTVGISHRSSFGDRLPRNASDPMAMNPRFASSVTRKCKSASSTVDQDFKTPNKLDNQYYKNVLNHEVLFTSDAALESSKTKRLVKQNLIPNVWEIKFKQAMRKMGSIAVKTKANGEIRKNCRLIN
ncbi:peroxidase 2-like [Lolium rigidum]|uniref:peroxidase 2-like n=1 Tax=Lolium rigidum TaxID=89674 RepID=UPI001F5DF061|nr:peroxidase 2-like [Lolium rigidum]